MTKWQWFSLLVLVGCLMVIAAWDAIALHFQGRKASLSYLVTMATYHAPIVAFLFGVLAGHLFWPAVSYQDDAMPIRHVEITLDSSGKVISRRECIVERLD